MMKRATLAALALTAVVARPSAAQEKVPPPVPAPEKNAPAAPEKLPAPLTAPVVEPAPGCGIDGDKPCPTTVLWIDTAEIGTLLVPREIVTKLTRPTMAIAYRQDKRVVSEIVIRSRLVDKQEVCTVLKPFTEVDATGCAVTVMREVPEVRTVKELEYYPETVQKTLIIPVPYLKPAEEVVVQKSILLEYQNELRKKGYAVRVPGGEVRKDQYIRAPQPEGYEPGAVPVPER
jgi:hypothetical protein